MRKAVCLSLYVVALSSIAGVIAPARTDALVPVRLADVRERGFVGHVQDRLFAARVFSDFAKTEVWNEARGAFAHPDDDVYNKGIGMWRGEFWGKLMISACRVAEHTSDAALKDFLHEEALRLISYQKPDGYLGTYVDPDNVLPPSREECIRRVGWPCMRNWNGWCRKYTLWGLLACYRLTGDKTLLSAAMRAADNQIAIMRRLGLKLCDTGTTTMRGLPPCSILKPLLWLYQDTGKVAYLDYAREIVGYFSDGESRAPQFAAKLATGRPLGEWYPTEIGRWGKAYEMMSLLDGFLEYYRVTGDEACLETVKAMQREIRVNEGNLCGSVGYNDQFVTASRHLNGITEPCDVIHWIRLNHDLYLITGDVQFADAIEEPFYNALLASVRPDGGWGARFIRSHGRNFPAPPQCGMKHQHCCVNNLPRGFLDVAQTILARDAEGTLNVALYHDSVSRIGTDTVTVSGNYPIGDLVKVRVEKSIAGTIRFRMPSWCGRLTLNGPEVVRVIRQPGWVEVAAPKGISDWTLAFEMTPHIVCSSRVATDCDTWDYRFLRWYDAKKEPEAMKWFVTKPYAQILRGPLLLAKSLRVGDTEEALIPSESVNVDRTGESWQLTSEPLAVTGVWGAWKLTFRLGEKAFSVNACDFPSADDWNGTSPEFSTLY